MNEDDATTQLIQRILSQISPDVASAQVSKTNLLSQFDSYVNTAADYVQVLSTLDAAVIIAASAAAKAAAVAGGATTVAAEAAAVAAAASATGVGAVVILAIVGILIVASALGATDDNMQTIQQKLQQVQKTLTDIGTPT